MTIKIPVPNRKHIHVFSTAAPKASTYDRCRPITTIRHVLDDTPNCEADGTYCSSCAFNHKRASNCASSLNAYIRNSPEWAAFKYVNPELFI